jgi:hypothetical protein
MTKNEKSLLTDFLNPGSTDRQKHPGLGCSWLNMEVDPAQQDQLIGYLGKVIQNTYVDSEYLNSVLEREGFVGAAKLFKERYEKNNSFGVLTGDFGEIIGHTVLMDIFEYKIPIFKIRYKTNWKKAVFGIDIIAFRLDDDPSKDAVVFSEVKASSRKGYGVKTVFDELKNLVENDLPEEKQKMRNAVRFVSERLYDQKQYELEKRIYRFLDSYSNPHYIEGFFPFLIRDKNTWNNDALKNIVIEKPDPNRIVLCLFVIEDLDKVIQAAYAKASQLES